MLPFTPYGSSISPGFEAEPPEAAEDEGDLVLDPPIGRKLPPLSLPPISSKPWFVVATKADLPGTQDHFLDDTERTLTYVYDVRQE